MEKDGLVKKVGRYILLFCASCFLGGCVFVVQPGRRSDIRKIEELSQQLAELNQVKQLLEERLSKEIADKEVSLNMAEKGLVITFVADVLFDSGKADIKPTSYPALDKIATVLRENIPDLQVGIEGHTDNQPIKYSGWKSNWELSTARALSVLHYLQEKGNLAPQRLTAIGYGEYHPVASNDTAEGRQRNRRVEIVIMPRLSKVRESALVEGKASSPKEEVVPAGLK